MKRMRFAPAHLGDSCKVGVFWCDCAEETGGSSRRSTLPAIVLVFLLAMVRCGWAEEHIWTGGRWNPSWCNPLNWGGTLGDPDGVPGPNDTAFINPLPYRGPVVDCNVHICGIKGPRYNSDSDQVMDVIHGDVLIDGDWQTGAEGSGTAVINISGDTDVNVVGCWRLAEHGTVIIDVNGEPNITAGDYIQGGDGADGRLEFTMSGGNLYVDDIILVGDNGSGFFEVSGGTVSCSSFRVQVRAENATGELSVSGGEIICRGGDMRICDGEGTASLNVSGGVVSVAADLTMAGDEEGAGIINMTGGSVGIGGTLVVPGDTEGTGTVNLHGGTIECGSFTHRGDNWSMDIESGVLLIEGDRTVDIRADADAGRITAYQTRGSLRIDYDNMHPGRTTVWAEPNLARAWGPDPPDKATSAASGNLALGWQPGDNAVLHHVFLSTDYDAVVNDEGAAFKETQGTTSYACDPPALTATYYWRIDEEDANHLVARGDLWRFTVEERRVVDDMEAYNKYDNYIFDTWRDGCGDLLGMNGNGTASCVDLTMLRTHSGARSMRYVYQNNCCVICCWDVYVCYSEATRTFAAPQNWAASGEKALVMWFYGDRWNDSTSMWVVLNGNTGAIATYGDNGDDPADIMKEQWIDWNIRLADFTDGGVDLSNVESITIGFGDRIGGEPSGMGIVHFDDIGLYPTRCVPKYAREIVDLNADCVVDIRDLALLAYGWLEDRG